MPPSSEIVEAADVEERDDVFDPVDDTDGESDDFGDVDESSQYDPIEVSDLVEKFENSEDAWDRVCDAAPEVHVLPYLFPYENYDTSGSMIDCNCPTVARVPIYRALI